MWKIIAAVIITAVLGAVSGFYVVTGLALLFVFRTSGLMAIHSGAIFGCLIGLFLGIVLGAIIGVKIRDQSLRLTWRHRIAILVAFSAMLSVIVSVHQTGRFRSGVLRAEIDYRRGDTEAILPRLFSVLKKEQDPNVRKWASFYLRQICDIQWQQRNGRRGTGYVILNAEAAQELVLDTKAKQELVQLLIDGLSETEPDNRGLYVWCLWRLRPEAKAAIPAITKLQTDEDYSLGVEAAYALALLGSHEKINIAALFDVVRIDGRATYRDPAILIDTAVRSQLNVGETISTLTDALNDENDAVRRIAADCFRYGIGSKKSALVEALKSQYRDVRMLAVATLGRRYSDAGNEADIPLNSLVEMLADSDRNVRWEAAHILERIDSQIAPIAVANAIADQPTIENNKGDRLTFQGFGSPPPVILQPRKRLRIRLSYTLASTNQCYIWAEAYTKGKKTSKQKTERPRSVKPRVRNPNVGVEALPTPLSNRKQIRETFIYFDDSSKQIDEIRIKMTNKSRNTILELSIDADVNWRRRH